MTLFLNIILGSGLLLTFLQDWKFRAVHWVVFPVLGATALFLLKISLIGHWEILIYNAAFLITVIFCLSAYVMIKEGRFVNLFREHFGFGDLLFLLVIIPLFSPQNYILFFITGMFLSALLHLLLTIKKPISTIPLAGYLAIYLLLLKIVDWIGFADPFTTTLVH